MADESIRQRTHKSVDRIIDKAENIRDSGEEKLAHLKEKSIIIKEDVDGYIRRNPEASVLIAAGIGAIVGALIAALMMRRRD